MAIHLLRLQLADDQLLVALCPDPQGVLPCMARGAGHALWPVDRPTGPAGAALQALGRALGAEAPGSDTGAAVARLADLAANLRPPAHLVDAGTVPADLRLPRWSPLVRVGAPPPGAVLPFDPEAAGIRAGLRRVLKRDRLSEPDRRLTRDWLRSRGLLVAELEDVLLAASSAADLAEAVDAERSLGGPDRDAAARLLGDALGYPGCCVDAYLAQAVRDDAMLLARRLLPPAAAPASPAALWIGPYALVSHAPCSPGCSATAALGRSLLALMEDEHPGFASRWETLARRLHVIEPDGRLLAVRCDGPLEPGALRVEEALQVVPSGAGVELRPVSWALEPGSGGLLADHRAA